MPKRKWKDDRDVGGYVALSFEMLDHSAFRSISEAAIRVLLNCLRKAYGPGRYEKIFKFTYPEAKNKLKMSDSTFRRVMKQLHSVGFIDYYSPGGRRGSEYKDPKGYQLSLRWKNYGAPNFEKRHEGYFNRVQA